MRILAAAALAAMTLLCAPAEAGSEPQIYYHPALLGSRTMPPLPNLPLYWLVERFPSQKAAEAASGQTGIAIEKDRKFWLFSIRHQGEWSSGSVHLTQVGPLPIPVGPRYTLRIGFGETTPASQIRIHTHAGPETWYVVSGSQCAETPAGVLRSKILPPNTPVRLVTTSAHRRAFFMVLHDATKPWTIPSGWRPTRLCDAQIR